MTARLAAFIVGTRPEAIKCAPVLLRARDDTDIQTELIATSQHRQLQDEALQAFGLSIDFDLDLMQPRSDLTRLVGEAWRGLSRRFEERRPDIVLVQGDTTTAFIAALSAFYQKIPVAHIEAGLRTYNKAMPYPEETNRRMISAAADLHFAPTRGARDNLVGERIDPASILITGNPGIDAFLWMAERASPQTIRRSESESLIVATCHRRENWGANIESICRALAEITQKALNARIVFAVHPNPAVREPVERLLGDVERIELRDALPYPEMAGLLAASDLVLTDSGGIQEEAPALGKPVIVLRETTERPEGVEGESALLVGANRQRIVEAALSLLTDNVVYSRHAQRRSPYGDGHAAERIWQGVRWHFGLDEPPKEFSPKDARS